MSEKRNENNKVKRDNVIIKIQPQEMNLTELKELLKKRKKGKKKKNKKGKIIGYVITFIGIIALILSLIINRLVDREYFPDSVIIFIMGVSILSLLFGFYILIKEN